MLATKSYLATQPERESLGVERVSTREQARALPRHSFWDRASLFGCIALCAAIGWFLAASSAQVATANQTINQLKTEIQQVSATNASYTAELATLTQPSRILKVALGMHMVHANPVEIHETTSTGAN